MSYHLPCSADLLYLFVSFFTLFLCFIFFCLFLFFFSLVLSIVPFVIASCFMFASVRRDVFLNIVLFMFVLFCVRIRLFFVVFLGNVPFCAFS